MKRDLTVASKTFTVRSALAALIGYSAWLVLTFFASQLLLVVLLSILEQSGVDFSGLNQNLLTISLGVSSYVLMIALTIGLPQWVMRKLTTLQEVGLQRNINWLDIALASAGLLTSFVLSAVLMGLAIEYLPWFNVDQAQETGITAPQQGIELILVFALFVVVAPFVEEILFRGYLYGKFRANGVPFWLATIVVSVLFGVAHGQWNVGINTFALSLVMCSVREISGSLWPAILIHMMKNGIAYYFLFINPQIIQDLIK